MAGLIPPLIPMLYVEVFPEGRMDISVEHLWDSLLAGIPAAFQTPLKPVDLGGLTSLSQASFKGVKEGLTFLYNPKPEPDISVFAAKCAGAAQGVDTVSLGILALTTALSLVPTASIGDAIDEVWRTPFLSAIIRQTTDWYNAPYDYGTKPYLMRHYAQKYRAMLPEPYRLAEMVSKGLVDVGTYEKAMAQNGLSQLWASRWRRAQQIRPEPVHLMALLRRGDINVDEYKVVMERTGYTDISADWLLKLKNVIPPIPDLTVMAVREAFGDHSYEAQYPAYESWAMKMGLSKEFAANYWYAHWERIPLRQMYDNLWRENWTEEQFMRMLRIKDVHPDDRDAILNVAYLPPSIREMGYGYDSGVYDRDDIVRYRKWGGMSPEDAEKAADSLILYRTSAEIDAVRREWLYAFAWGRIEYEEYAQELMDLETPDAALPFWLKRGELLRERYLKPIQDVEGRVISSAEAKWGFKNKFITEPQLRGLLKQLDWTDARIELMVKRLQVEMLPIVEEPEEVKERLLTVSQLTGLFKVGEITEEYLDAKLSDMGYTDESILLMKKMIKFEEPAVVGVKPFTSATAVGLYDYEMFDEEDLLMAFEEMGYDDFHSIINVIYARLRLEYPIISSLYEKGIYSYNNMLDEFKKLDLTDEQADNLADKTRRELQIERLTKEKDLTKAEIVKGVKNDVINVMDGVELLVDIGYDEWEAQYILAINKVVAAGDPEGYWDMKRVTEAYKKARGLKAIEVPDEAIELEKMINTVRAELKKASEDKVDDKILAEKTRELNDLELKMRTLLQQKLLR